MKKLAFVLSLVLFVGINLFAQNESIEFNLIAPDTVPPNTPFEIVVEAKNIPQSNIDTETFDFGKLSVQGRPSIFNMSTSINGKRSDEIKYTYRVIAPKEGTFMITPFTVFVDKKAYKTKTTKIVAKEGAVLEVENTENSFFGNGNMDFFGRRLPNTPVPPTPPNNTSKSGKKRKVYRI